MKIVVNTPAGNIGRVVTDRLLEAKKDVVIISRNPAKVAGFAARGAQLIQGSIDDLTVLDDAFRGADALFWLTPISFDKPDYIKWARRAGQDAANAAKRHGIGRVVVVSSVGAQHENGVGPIGCLLAVESAFNAAVPNVASLRAASFMENFLSHIGSIANMGTIFGSYPADKKIPMVASRDIADGAFEALLGHRGDGRQIIGVQGPEDLSQLQAAEIISEGIGRAVKYVEVTDVQARQGMTGAGIPAFFVELLLDMYRGLREGRMERAEPRTPATTTKTSLLEFSRTVIKPAVEAATKEVA
jgi:uncharacterized protein YbjT (DUF2867 family)